MFKKKFKKTVSKRHSDRAKRMHLSHLFDNNDLQDDLSDGSSSRSVSKERESAMPDQTSFSASGTEKSMGAASKDSSDSDHFEQADSQHEPGPSSTENKSDVPDDPSSSENESDGENPRSEAENLLTDLGFWATSHNVNHNTLDSLLTVLRQYGHSELPKTARTLLKTPKSTTLRDVPPGEYVHFGLENCLIEYISTLPSDDLPDNINVLVNVDGVPINKNSGQLWPILGSVHGKSTVSPFIIGIFYGKKKPADCNLYLADFINEATELTNHGIKYEDLRIPFRLLGLICDAPARSFIAGIKGHSGFFGCGKCVQEGEYLKGRVCFPDSDAPLRTDQTFRDKTHKEHHVLMDPDLEKIPGFGMVSEIAFEYMHLTCQGVMKKLLREWMGSKNLAVRLRSSKIDQISAGLIELKIYTCTEFARKPQSLRELANWKATELRLTMLYIGPHAFKNILSDAFYEHFLCLHVAMRILASPQLCIKRNAYAKALMKHFIQVFGILYGRHLISYNIHGLLHLPDDVLKFGPVDKFSTFEFENHLQTVKKLIRKSDRPLQQAANRLYEKKVSALSSLKNTKKPDDAEKMQGRPAGIHVNGPLAHGTCNPQYESVKLHGFIYSKKLADNCCILKNGLIVAVANIATVKGELVIIGHSFKSKKDAFTVPCVSSEVGIFLASDMTTSLQKWPVTDIDFKAMRIPKGNDTFLVVSLLHGLNK